MNKINFQFPLISFCIELENATLVKAQLSLKSVDNNFRASLQVNIYAGHGYRGKNFTMQAKWLYSLSWANIFMSSLRVCL